MKRKRSKSKSKKKIVRGPSCPTTSRVSVMNKTFVTRPSNSVCMALARKFATTERNYHQTKFCNLASCKPSGKCTAMAYFCYRLTPQAKKYKLTVTVKTFCKCLSIPIPSTTRLVIYDCNKV
jgi:hypothetical protein